MLCTKEEGLSYGTVQQCIHIRTMRHIFIIFIIDHSPPYKQAMLPFKILRLPYYQDFIVRRNHNLQCSNKMQDEKKISLCNVQRKVIDRNDAYKMRLCNLVDQSRAIFHSYIRSVGGQILHSLGFVFEYRPRLEWADLSTLSENASFNDFAHSRAQGRS